MPIVYKGLRYNYSKFPSHLRQDNVRSVRRMCFPGLGFATEQASRESWETKNARKESCQTSYYPQTRAVLPCVDHKNQTIPISLSKLTGSEAQLRRTVHISPKEKKPFRHTIQSKVNSEGRTSSRTLCPWSLPKRSLQFVTQCKQGIGKL
jgi:hypothetical protein